MSFQYYPMLKYRKCPFNIIPLYYTENVLSILSYSTVLYYTENVLQYYSYSTVFYRKCAFSIIPTQLYFTENVLSISSRSIIQKISFPIRGWSVGKDLQGKTVKSGQTENWQLYSCTNRELAALFLF